MSKPSDYREVGCRECCHALDLGFDFSMAFQPIVDVNRRRIFAYEALVRGLAGEPAGTVFQNVDQSNLYRFDQSCRVKAVKLAAALGVDTLLSINFMPNAIYKPELCIRTTLLACEEYGFSSRNIIFEVTEQEKVVDLAHLHNIVEHYRHIGFHTAIDDFGAGYAGLNMLLHVKPSILKIDMDLIRGVESDQVRQSLVRAVLQFCRELNIEVIAEGVETREEYVCLKMMGVGIFQGYYFARPGFERLPAVDFDVLD